MNLESAVSLLMPPEPANFELVLEFFVRQNATWDIDREKFRPAVRQMWTIICDYYQATRPERLRPAWPPVVYFEFCSGDGQYIGTADFSGEIIAQETAYQINLFSISAENIGDLSRLSHISIVSNEGSLSIMTELERRLNPTMISDSELIWIFK